MATGATKPSRKRKLEEVENISVLSGAPRDIHILDFAESRAAEIEALSRSCNTIGGAKRVFQTLPRHMRRRAMSHHIKRLPRRLQEQAAREYDAREQKKTVSKRPSRRHRRRPQNLLSEYSRRQRKHCWLETHIWHAKRFKMADMWGYRVPVHPYEKSKRASYRAIAKHCLLQDVSYLCCIEVTGSEELILQGLTHVTNPKTGKTFAARTSLNGSREGQTMMYSFRKYPYGAIASVTFLWKPGNNSVKGSTERVGQRHLWIWCHPSCYKQVWEELCLTYSMPKSADVLKETSEPLEKEKVFMENPVISNGSVTLSSLKDSVLRFRLWGPLSQAVLSDLFKKPVIKTDGNSKNLWWRDYYEDDSLRGIHQQQWQTWNSMKTGQSAAEFSPHTVLGLTVRDPRIFLPPKKTKFTNNKKSQTTEGMLHQGKDDAELFTAQSPLWDADVRACVRNKLSEQEINKKRSEILIPGSVLELGEEEARIPVILIQRPGDQGRQQNEIRTSLKSNLARAHLGLASGWDLIVPAGWGMAFWIGLVYRGARVGGSREAENAQKELGQLHFPSDFPDTKACQQHQLSLKQELSDKHGRYPPAKRPHFVKFGIVKPFCCPWQHLVQEWYKNKAHLLECSKPSGNGAGEPDVGSEERYFVLRDRYLLKKLCSIIEGSSTMEMILLNLTAEMRENFTNSIVGVRLNMCKRGTPEQFAAICLPMEEDLKRFREDPNYGGPEEPIHKDISESKKLQKTEAATNIGHPESPLGSSCRQIIGFVNSGGFSLSHGFGAGMGFCSTLGLLQMQSAGICLTRAQNSLQYRFVRVNILL